MSKFLAFFVTTLLIASQAQAKVAEILVKHDGKRKALKLKEASLDVNIEQSTARLTYTLTYVNELSKQLEGTFYFKTPQNGYVDDFGYWVNNKQYQGSVITEAKKGRIAYESTVRRMVDPALLEWSGSNIFKMRVFPIQKKGETKVRITVAMPAALEDYRYNYRIPTDLGKATVAKIRFNVYAVSNASPIIKGINSNLKLEDSQDGIYHYTAGKTLKNRLLPPYISVSYKELRHNNMKTRRYDDESQRYFESRAFLPLERMTIKKRPKTIVLWDNSLSEESSHRLRVAALKGYFDGKKSVDASIITFGYGATRLGRNLDSWQKVQSKIKTITYDGGTNFKRLYKLVSKLQGLEKTDILIFTNGVESLNFKAKRTKKIEPTLAARTFILTPSLGADTASINRMAQIFNAKVMKLDRDFKLAFTQKPWKIQSLSTSRNVSETLNSDQKYYYPGSGLVLRGILNKDGPVKIDLVLSNGKEKKQIQYKFDTSNITPSPYDRVVARLWARAKINDLMANRKQNRATIQSLGIKHQLMTPYTVRIVMEYCDDYEKFKITPPKDCPVRPKRTYAYEDYEDEAEYDESSGDVAENEAEFDDWDEEYAEAVMDTTLDESVDYEDESDLGFAEDASAAAMNMANSVDEDFQLELSEVEDANSSDYEYGYEEDEISYYERGVKESMVYKPDYEISLQSAAKVSWEELYSTYVKNRDTFKDSERYYIVTSSLMRGLKQNQLSDMILSNIVEINPNQAQALRAYAYMLQHSRRFTSSEEVLAAVRDLREEDPNTERDLALIEELKGNLLDAFKQLQTLENSKIDGRLSSIKTVSKEDRRRIYNKMNAESKSLVRYRPGKAPKVVVVLNWDTDNTNLDLYVSEPGMKQKKGRDFIRGRKNAYASQGWGPEQYTINDPYRGIYDVHVKFASKERFLSDAETTARVQVFLFENGKYRQYTRTVNLLQPGDTVKAMSFRFEDKSSPMLPKNFNTLLSEAKFMIKSKNTSAAQKVLLSMVAPATKPQKAIVYFHLARTYAQQKKYEQALRYNDKALVLRPSLYSAHYNNACYSSLKGKTEDAIHHLNLLTEALDSNPGSNKMYYYKLMRSDPDLKRIRNRSDFKSIQRQMGIAH